MIYTLRPGDTLLSVASSLTLSPAYATAIQSLNDIQGRAITDDMGGYGDLYIPDEWLRSSYTAQQLQTLGAGASSGTPWRLWALLAALAYFAT